MVGIACVFDFMDGLVARALNAHSEIGKQLDSLADMVSFGVVPGVIVFQLLKLNYSNHFIHFWFDDILPAVVAFLITIFSAIRLAKFNLDLRQSDSFIGLPTPANAILIASIPLVLQSASASEFVKEIILQPYFLIVLILTSSISLISSISLFALKFKNFSWVDNKVRYIFLLLSIALLIIFKFAGIPLIIILYIVLSIINNLVAKKSVKHL